MTVLASSSADLYARLDGLRTYVSAAPAAERDERLALEWAEARAGRALQDTPAWCPGCLGRGTETVCRVCAAPVPAALRCRPGGPSGLHAPAV